MDCNMIAKPGEPRDDINHINYGDLTGTYFCDKDGNAIGNAECDNAFNGWYRLYQSNKDKDGMIFQKIKVQHD